MNNEIPKTIVIVGGGFGGVKLAFSLANYNDFKVHLISKTADFEYHSALYRAVTGWSSSEVIIRLDSMLGGFDNIEITLDEITGINTEKNVVISSTNKTYHYDKVVFATGKQLNTYGNDQLEREAYSIYTIQDAMKLRRQLHDMVISDKSELNFVVVGAGASGTELAAELPHFLNKLCYYHSRAPKKVRVTLVEENNRILPMLNEGASRNALQKLRRLGVEIKLNSKAYRYQNNILMINEGSINTETVIWTAGGKNNSIFLSNSIFKSSGNGLVKVDKYLQVHPDVYVIGDNADTPYSGMAQTALADASFVANDLLGSDNSRAIYKPRSPIYVVSTGPKSVVFQWRGLSFGGRIAWMLRRLADRRLFSDFQPLKTAVKSWRAENKGGQDKCGICN